MALDVILLLGFLAGRLAQVKAIATQEKDETIVTQKRERALVTVAVAAIAVFWIGGQSLLLFAAVPGFLAGRFTKKDRVAYILAAAAILVALHQMS